MIPPATLIIYCYAFTSNLFPIYSALKNKTNEEGYKVFGIASAIAVVFFSGVSILGILCFGENVTMNAGNLIFNINEEIRHNESGGGHWEAFLLRAIYFIILVTHVAPIFFPGKEAVLIMIDEIDRRSISNTLEERIKLLKLKEANEQLDEDGLDGSMKEEIENLGRASASGTEASRRPEDSNVAVRKTAHKDSRMSSHQSMIRAMKNTEGGVDGVKSRVTSIVSIIRETQTLMASVKVPNLKGSQVNEDGTETEEGISNKLAYKDMKDVYYWSASLISLAIVCFLAIEVPNVAIVFNLVSIVSCNCTSFFFPSIFYISAAKRYYADRK